MDKQPHAICDRLVELGIFAAIAIAPAFMGGRHPLGQLVLVAIVTLTACVWCIGNCLNSESRWKKTGVEWLLVAAIAIVVLQLTPFSAQNLSLFSPSISEVLPTRAVDHAPASSLWAQSWSTISLTPQTTQVNLVLLLAYAMLFVLVVQHIKNVRSIERIVKYIALTTIGYALLAISQYMFGNGKFFWIYHHPFRDTLNAANGPFSNPNHFAHFMALGMGPLAWWIATSYRDASGNRNQRPSHRIRNQRTAILLAFGAGIVCVSGILSNSRGGLLSLMIAGSVSLIAFSREFISKKNTLALLGIMAVCCFGVLFTIGDDSLWKELSQTSIRSVDDAKDQLNRFEIWRAVSSAIPNFARLGSGAGSHSQVYKTYYDSFSSVECTHAESGYLQILLETGLPGFALLIAAIVICIRWFYTALHSEHRSITFALLPGLSASLIHSLVDFVWFIPACISLTLVLVACLRVLYVTTKRDNEPVSSDLRSFGMQVTQWEWAMQPAVCVAALIAVGLCSFGMVREIAPVAAANSYWEQYLLETSLPKIVAEKDMDQRLAMLDAVAERLEETLAADPNHVKARVRLAEINLMQFEALNAKGENGLPLGDLRDAAMASAYSRAEVDEWLGRAVGDAKAYLRRALEHAYYATKVSPMEGKAYLLMSEVSFLLGHEQSERTALLKQSHLVRPYDGQISMVIGLDALRSGDMETATDWLCKAAKTNPSIQNKLVAELGSQYPASFFLDNMELNCFGLRQLFWQLAKEKRFEELPAVAEAYLPALTELVEDKEQYEKFATKEFHLVYFEINDTRRSLQAAERAILFSPDDFQLHRNLSKLLLQEQRKLEASDHLRWCLQHRPNDAELRAELASCNERPARFAR